jgi:DNA primase
MKHEQLTFHDALRYLAKKYHIEIEERELTAEEKLARSDRDSMLIVNSWAQRYFSTTLYEHEDGRNIGLSYFRERGFREDIIKKFQLGYSLDDRDALFRTAIKQGYKKEYLEKTGLVIAYDNGSISDRFRGRVIFPIHTLGGKVVAFGGRILKKDEKTAKYLNSPESEIYHKSNELYGIYLARQSIVKEQRCYLVEGYTDVISMHQAGIENVVASSGTALTHGQIRLIHRFTENITVLYDGDAAGIKAALRGIDLLLEEGLNVKVLLLPDGEDPDSFARKHNAEQFVNYIKGNETDFVVFKTQLLLADAGSDPVKRASLISDIIRTIAIIPDNISRLLYIKECSSMMDIDEREIVNEVGKIRKTPSDHRSPSAQPVAPQQKDVSVQTGEDLPPPVQDSPLQQSPFEKNEILLLRYAVRYGEHILDEITDEETSETIIIRVAEYIYDALTDDDMPFLNPLYHRMLKEAAEHCGDPNFISSRYFLNHSDPQVSRLAVELIDDKYQLSKYHAKFGAVKTEEEKLFQIVPQDIFNFKDAYIRYKIEDVDRRMKDIQQTGDMDEIFQLMKEKETLNTIKKELNKIIGERIIIKM